MARKAVKKTAKKAAASKAKAPPLISMVIEADHSHEMHLHNITNKAASWTLTGGSNQLKGNSPPNAESLVLVSHAKSYKVTFWTDPKAKASGTVGPDGSAIYTGKKVYVTHPH